MGRLQSLFPSHQLDVVIGSLLGDACLECRSVGIRHPVTATIVKDRSKFKIALGAREYQKFSSIIQPYIAPSMNYKIVNPRNDFSDVMSEGVKKYDIIIS